MMVENFLKIVEEIEYSCLSDRQQEELVIKVADLNRFIDSYNPSIEILDCYRYKMNIIKESGIKKGIVICDSEKIMITPSSYYHCNLMSIKSQEELEELWLVHINNCFSNELSPFLNFVDNNDVEKVYDKIFSLDFLRSQVYNIK